MIHFTMNIKSCSSYQSMSGKRHYKYPRVGYDKAKPGITSNEWSDGRAKQALSGEVDGKPRMLVCGMPYVHNKGTRKILRTQLEKRKW